MILGIWWTLFSILAIFQIYFMSRFWIIIPIGLAFSTGVMFAHIKLYKSLIKNKRPAKYMYFIYTGIHFIPLALQIFGLRIPSIDTIISALIGTAMIYVYQN